MERRGVFALRSSHTSTVSVASPKCESVSVSPRDTDSRDASVKLTAVRAPGGAASISRLCDCSERTRALRFPGCNTAFWPFSSTPPLSVPVTTVPIPFRVNTRSTASRGLPRSRGGGVCESTVDNSSFSSSIPSPVRDDTGTMATSSSGVPTRCSRTSSTANSTSASARSALVKATTPCVTPR